MGPEQPASGRPTLCSSAHLGAFWERGARPHFPANHRPLKNKETRAQYLSGLRGLPSRAGLEPTGWGCGEPRAWVRDTPGGGEGADPSQYWVEVAGGLPREDTCLLAGSQDPPHPCAAPTPLLAQGQGIGARRAKGNAWAGALAAGGLCPPLGSAGPLISMRRPSPPSAAPRRRPDSRAPGRARTLISLQMEAGGAGRNKKQKLRSGASMRAFSPVTRGWIQLPGAF